MGSPRKEIATSTSIAFRKALLFVELYCTRSGYHDKTQNRFPAELYDEKQQLDLARLAPEVMTSGATPYGDWSSVKNIPCVSFIATSALRWSRPRRKPKRIVWFVSSRPADMVVDDRAYFNRTGITTVGAANIWSLGPRLLL